VDGLSYIAGHYEIELKWVVADEIELEVASWPIIVFASIGLCLYE
jgi:hypothetical protein